MNELADFLPPWLWSVTVAAIAILLALAAHWLLFRIIVKRASGRQGRLETIICRRLRRPLRWVFVAVALTAVQPLLLLSEEGARLWSRAAGFILPALVGWSAVGVLGIMLDAIQLRADISVADNLGARRRRTRAAILYRVGTFVILAIAFSMMLMSIPSFRNIGLTLIASAGIVGLAVGAAAQPALKNLIAGVQMAFTEPIRIDDVVIIDGEWGRIEEVRLTYVVVKLWDERRLIVPVSQFLEKSFQNWTRETSQILGSVIWHFDPATDVDRLREKLGELVRDSALWDGRFFNLQVTDTGPDHIQVRALVTAKDASMAFDLRCEIREKMLRFVRDEMPGAITRRRAELKRWNEAVQVRSDPVPSVAHR